MRFSKFPGSAGLREFDRGNTIGREACWEATVTVQVGDDEGLQWTRQCGCEMVDARQLWKERQGNRMLCLEHAGFQEWRLEQSCLKQQDTRVKWVTGYWKYRESEPGCSLSSCQGVPGPFIYAVFKQSKFIHTTKHMQPAAKTNQKARMALRSNPAQSASPGNYSA